MIQNAQKQTDKQTDYSTQRKKAAGFGTKVPNVEAVLSNEKRQPV